MPHPFADSCSAPASRSPRQRPAQSCLQRLQQLGAAVVIGLLVSGCASTMSAQVTSFHQLSNGLQGQRFVINPSAEQRNSLEFETYANLVREALTDKGLVDAGGAAGTADLGVSLNYEVAGRSSGVGHGTTGYAGFGAGSGGFSMGGVGIGIGIPIGGFGGSDSVVYQRSLDIAITRLNGAAGKSAEVPAGRGDAAGTARVFEARAISEGPSASLAPVMRAMVQAIFQEFPGPSGQTRVVEVPLERGGGQ
jgi:hypothetical protein